MDKKRIAELDISKGIGMIFVILGHFLLLDGLIKYWVMSFYMPLFVIISGMLFSRKDILFHTKRILFSYFILGFACIIFYDLFFEKNKLYLDLNGLIHGCTAPYFVIDASAPLWFLTMYFVLRIIYDTCDRYFKDDLLLLIVVILGFIGCKLSVLRDSRKIIYNFDLALLFIPLFHFGRLLKGKNFLEKILCMDFVKKNLLMLLFFLMSILLFEFNRGYDVFREGYGGNLDGDALLFYLGSIAGTMFILLLSLIISKIPILSSFLSLIGRNTLVILAIHYPLTKIALVLSEKYFLNVVWKIFLFFIVLFLSLVFSRIISFIANLITQKNNKQ